MSDAIIGQYRQCGRHSDTVVRAQRGAARFHPFAVNVRLDRIFNEVVDGVVIFLRHHIEVRLQRYRLTVFHTGSRAFTNQNVANLVAFRM
ncbi:Uncharacterised protein [Klebsiella pneumoniae]|nr:Uncharacterised protein [Klebsiella pneumoniae]SSW83777.1 Uncharacterised protein [Klebsiella pneumoniae]